MGTVPPVAKDGNPQTQTKLDVPADADTPPIGKPSKTPVEAMNHQVGPVHHVLPAVSQVYNLRPDGTGNYLIVTS